MRDKRMLGVLALLLPAALAVYSWKMKRGDDDRDKVTKNVSVPEFRNISITGMCDVKFVQGAKTSVMLKGDRKTVDATEVTVANGTLTIRQKRNSGRSKRLNLSVNKSLEAYVVSPNINDVTITGSGDFSSKGLLSTDVLRVKISGSGDTEIDMLETKNASFVISGSGDVDVKEKGVAETSVSACGSGDITLHGIGCGRISGKVSGSSDVKLSGVFAHVDVRTSGFSTLRYNK